MKLRKVGGIYFWNIGRFGGSFYAKKPVEKAPVNVDWLGMSVCFVMAFSFFIS